MTTSLTCPSCRRDIGSRDKERTFVCASCHANVHARCTRVHGLPRLASWALGSDVLVRWRWLRCGHCGGAVELPGRS